MNRTITLQMAAFSRLIAEIAYKPDPNDPDDDGPGLWSTAARPFDRYDDPRPIPWRDRAGEPRPIPWISVREMREQIARVRDHYELASLLTEKTPIPQLEDAIGKRLLSWVDEKCPPLIKVPIPRPPRPWWEMAGILVAAAELQQAAQQAGPLQAQFQAAADHFFDNAAARVEMLSKNMLAQKAAA